MNKKRLMILARKLERVPQQRFRLDEWASGLNMGDCQTIACACGWACTIPSFERDGLHLVIADHLMPIQTTIKYGRWSGFVAASKFFGIDHADAVLLFSPIRYDGASSTGPREVAQRIRDFVRTGKAA